MVARLSAFVIWALVAATAVFWGLRLTVRAPGVPPGAVAVGADTAALRADLSRVLGSSPTATAAASPAAPAAASRFKLLGIMAPRPGTAPGEGGVALIAVDNKPARAFPVGTRVDGDLVLQAVSLRSAELGPGQGAASLKLELPALAAPATGTLPPPGSGASLSGATTAGNVGQPGNVVPPAIPGAAPVAGTPGLRPGLGATQPQAAPAQNPPGVMPPPAREPGATSSTTR